MTDKFWAEDIFVLNRNDRYLDFFPTNEMTYEEQLNAITRFSLYLSVLLSLYKSNIKFLLISIIVMVFTIILYQKDEKIQSIRTPTKANPYMNYLPYDYETGDFNTKRPEKVNKKLLYDDLPIAANEPHDEVYGNYNFYPVSGADTLPNERGELVDWLSHEMNEKQERGNYFNDLRRGSQVFSYTDPKDLQTLNITPV